MARMLIRHLVADFSEWKTVFDDHLPVRQAAGLTDLHLWRSADNPNEVVVLFEAADLAKAKEFASSSELKDVMEAAGVQGAPEFLFLHEG